MGIIEQDTLKWESEFVSNDGSLNLKFFRHLILKYMVQVGELELEI